MTDTDRIKQELPSQEEVEGAFSVLDRIYSCVYGLAGERPMVTARVSFDGTKTIRISTAYRDALEGRKLSAVINRLFPSPEQATLMERERLERKREELETKLKETNEALEALK